MRKSTLLLRFNSKWKESPSGCWEWTAHRSARGYAQIGDGRGGRKPAHRTSYELFVGPIPPGMLVCHKCDNKGCVNPNHLFIGTSGDNMRDMAEKNRSTFGERSARAKLTSDEVREIIRMLSEGITGKDIANHFAINHRTVSEIKVGNNWKRIERVG